MRRQAAGSLPGEGGGYFENLQLSMQSLQGLEAQLNLAERRRDALRDQLRGGAPAAASGDDPMSGITTPRTELEKQIVELEDAAEGVDLRSVGPCSPGVFRDEPMCTHEIHMDPDPTA